MRAPMRRHNHSKYIAIAWLCFWSGGVGGDNLTMFVLIGVATVAGYIAGRKDA